MDQTANLALPYIAPQQAQKFITHNAALRRLDALVQLSVRDDALATPPVAPAEGDRYIIAGIASGAWTGAEGQIAAWQDGVWALYAPAPGWLAWVETPGRLLAWSGTDWRDATAGLSEIDNADHIGINTGADATNRLAVAAPASLFTHEGAGHQLKLDKNGAGDTASLLYQTGFSGRAEIGLCGDDKLHVKLSPDGANWTGAMTMDGVGNVGFGTDDPASQGADIVLVRNADAPAIMKVYNQSAGDSAQARFDLSTGLPNAYAIFGINNAAGSPYFFFSGGSGVSGVFLDWNLHVFRSPTGIERMRVDTTGNVGIGQSAPSAPLHVNGAVRVGTYSVATLPSAATLGAGAMVYVSDDSGGAVLAFSDGSAWRRVTDRVVVS